MRRAGGIVAGGLVVGGAVGVGFAEVGVRYEVPWSENEFVRWYKDLRQSKKEKEDEASDSLLCEIADLEAQARVQVKLEASRLAEARAQAVAAALEKTGAAIEATKARLARSEEDRFSSESKKHRAALAEAVDKVERDAREREARGREELEAQHNREAEIQSRKETTETAFRALKEAARGDFLLDNVYVFERVAVLKAEIMAAEIAAAGVPTYDATNMEAHAAATNVLVAAATLEECPLARWARVKGPVAAAESAPDASLTGELAGVVLGTLSAPPIVEEIDALVKARDLPGVLAKLDDLNPTARALARDWHHDIRAYLESKSMRNLKDAQITLEAAARAVGATDDDEYY